MCNEEQCSARFDTCPDPGSHDSGHVLALYSTILASSSSLDGVSLSRDAAIGIGVAFVVLFLAFVILTAACLWQRRKFYKKMAADGEMEHLPRVRGPYHVFPRVYCSCRPATNAHT